MATRLDLPAPELAQSGLPPRPARDTADVILGQPAPRHPGYPEVIAGIAGWLLVGLVAGLLLISPFARAFFGLLVASVVIFLATYQILRLRDHRPGYEHVPTPNTAEESPD